MKKSICALLCALSLLGSVQTWAWGPVGHIVIGTSAARMTEDQLKTIMFRKIGEGIDRSVQAGYYADYPDAGWKRLGPYIRRLETVTHIFQVGEIGSTAIPSNYDEAKAKFQGQEGKITHRPIDFFTTIGTAPWRSEQFRVMMIKELKTAKLVLDRGDKASARAHIQEAIALGGLMGHYIGDLTQPLHAAVDYNGWEHDQGGLHSYFEGKMVSAIDSKTIEATIRRRANELYPALYKAAQSGKDPVALLIQLGRNSASLANTVFQLDRQFALLQKSSIDPDGTKHRAKRREPSEVVNHFAPFLVERLAMGSAMLKVFWVSALAAAGSPDFSSLNIGSLPDQHGYIMPNYDKLNTSSQDMVDGNWSSIDPRTDLDEDHVH